MAMTRTVGWGVAGAATTMLARKMMGRAMHKRGGVPRLPQAARQRDSLGMTLLLAAAAGIALAVSDVFLEQKRRNQGAPS